MIDALVDAGRIDERGADVLRRQLETLAGVSSTGNRNVFVESIERLVDDVDDDTPPWDEETVQDLALGESGAAQAAVAAFNSWQEFATHIDGFLGRGHDLNEIGQTLGAGIMPGLKADLSRAMTADGARRVLLIAGMDNAVEQHERAGRLGGRPDDGDGDGQRGLNDIAAEVGTTEDIGRPGDTPAVREAIERWRDDIPPDGIGGWELIPKEERRGNYTFLAWTPPNRPLTLSLEAPIGPTSDEWGVVVSDGRISGFSSVPISGSSPADDRRTYPSRRAAGVAAIRWMATHPADRYQHPFFDSRIADPPDGWRNDSWRLEQRIEEWVFRPSRDAVPDTAPVPKIEVEGFHGGDSYQMTQMPVGLPEADPDGGYPARGETLPRGRMLDEVTRFMENNKPELQDLDRTPGPTFFDPPESSQIQHHAMRNDLHLVLSSAGIDRPVMRTLLEEFDDVNEFVDWSGDFQVFEGVGPATRERLNEIVELIERRDVDIGSGL